MQKIYKGLIKIYFYYVNNMSEIEEYEPKITSKYISIYEYAKLLTDLSLYLYNSPSLSKWIDNVEVKTLIDTNKLAYELLKNGTFDAVIDRGYEKVTFSKLKINPLYNSLIESFLNDVEKSTNESFLKVIGLLDERQLTEE